MKTILVFLGIVGLAMMVLMAAVVVWFLFVALIDMYEADKKVLREMCDHDECTYADEHPEMPWKCLDCGLIF